MIEKHELRIGNFIEKDRVIYRVSEILNSGVRVTFLRSDNLQLHTSLLSYEDINHVIVNDKWEEILGFKEGYLNLHRFLGIQLKFPYLYIIAGYPNREFEEDVYVKLQMYDVAKIQNLYHAIVGKDLEIISHYLEGSFPNGG